MMGREEGGLGGGGPLPLGPPRSFTGKGLDCSPPPQPTGEGGHEFPPNSLRNRAGVKGIKGGGGKKGGYEMGTFAHIFHQNPARGNMKGWGETFRRLKKKKTKIPGVKREERAREKIGLGTKPSRVERGPGVFVGPFNLVKGDKSTKTARPGEWV